MAIGLLREGVSARSAGRGSRGRLRTAEKQRPPNRWGTARGAYAVWPLIRSLCSRGSIVCQAMNRHLQRPPDVVARLVLLWVTSVIASVLVCTSGRMNKGGPRDIAPPSSVRCIVLFTAPKLFYPARARQNRPEAQEHRRISEPSMPAPARLRPLACQQYTTQPIITAATMSTARFVTGSKKLDELCSAAPWPPRLIVAAAAA